ncbi:high affinity immunoglobulin epsilon receptor subunit gamma [Lepisosteus oculatus]|uniref:high affinity immunoglobulin epsilon receptor subunit gamma n=1 Tax=Lepisosteus oculatus TaxID=7918 RepID=UPI0007401024|nr:PREDICTED: high affinity immunoglobulin epsilon receptor subunit gamma [Lepisosteus oculatus]
MSPLRKTHLFAALLLGWHFGVAAALQEPQICYILDGILFVYGIVLTVLYCRLKLLPGTSGKKGGSTSEKQGGESIYTGLAPRPQDTYETISPQKKARE